MSDTHSSLPVYCVGPLAPAVPTAPPSALVALAVLLLAAGAYLLRRRQAVA